MTGWKVFCEKPKIVFEKDKTNLSKQYIAVLTWRRFTIFVAWNKQKRSYLIIFHSGFALANWDSFFNCKYFLNNGHFLSFTDVDKVTVLGAWEN